MQMRDKKTSRNFLKPACSAADGAYIATLMNKTCMEKHSKRST